MRLLVLIITLLFIIIPVNLSAASGVDIELISEAQAYGQECSQYPLKEFFQPWTVYEKNSSLGDETRDRIYAYTPFLLIAADARDKKLNHISIKVSDGTTVLNEYSNYLVFGLKMWGIKDQFKVTPQFILEQKKKIVKPAAVYMPAKPSIDQFSTKRPFYMDGYIYFPISEIDRAIPFCLNIICSDKSERSFTFDLRRLR